MEYLFFQSTGVCIFGVSLQISISPIILPAWGNEAAQPALSREGPRGCARNGRKTGSVWRKKKKLHNTYKKYSTRLEFSSVTVWLITDWKQRNTSHLLWWNDEQTINTTGKPSRETAEWILLIGTVSYSCFWHVWPTDKTTARINTTACHTWTTFFSFFN